MNRLQLNKRRTFVPLAMHVRVPRECGLVVAEVRGRERLDRLDTRVA